MTDMHTLGWIALALTGLTVAAVIGGCIINDLIERDSRDCGPGTGTEAPLSDERVRELLTRENYERDCI